MLYRLEITKLAKKELNKLSEKYREKIMQQFIFLTADPFIGKKLKGAYEGFYSLRVWPYRAIYEIDKKVITIYVVKVEHRQGVYNN